MKIHIAPAYFMNPTHPVTISLVGCGGTGCQVLSSLGRIDHCLKSLGHPGLHVSLFDPDVVTESNRGRQLFCKTDIGLNKALVMASRINAFFGTSWEAIPRYFDERSGRSSNITISCVDNLSSRSAIAGYLKGYAAAYSGHGPYLTPYYWMDFGNGKETGQVVLGTVTKVKQAKSKQYGTVAKLPVFTERFRIKDIDEAESGPSCSLAEALEKQDLFINSSLAQLGCDLLWKLLKDGVIRSAGLYLNMKTGHAAPIPL